MIKDFGGRGKIWRPLPQCQLAAADFHETFQDDVHGYVPGHEGVPAGEVRSLAIDHYPQIVNDPGHRIADTYSITYMRALLRRANEEVG